MERDSRSAGDGKGSLEELLRERIGGIIELIVEQELEEALGAANSARVGEQRPGYRHGHRARTLTIVV
jgi:transposase-like protein